MAAITSCEFAHLLQSCRPPSGWGTITVALSGGPDSLGLLVLLRNHRPALPVRSITVDHGLQPTSHASAVRTHERAIAMGVPNVVLPAEWSNPIESGRAFEEAARQARYRALWRGLWDDDTPGPKTLMFAHHADDQLETVLMRVLRGTGTYGMGGMRALRRWGMVGVKSEEALKGMNTWLCRPLLSIPKDRIVATCVAHGLEYEVDRTNSMPELTIRNAFRHALVDSSAARPELAAVINRVHTLSGGSTSSALDIPRMRSYVGRMSARVREVDEIVSTYLSKHTHPSPPSTLVLVPTDLDTLPPDASHALVHRILRYVSPHPWGSVQSEGGRKSSRTQRILDMLQSNHTTTFTAGAQVLWSPVTIRPDGSIRTRSIGMGAGSRAWLASRLPTPRATPLEMETPPGSVLWDNRFLVHVPPGSGRVLIGLEGRYLLPRVVRVSENGRASDVGRMEPEKVRTNVEFIRELGAI